MVQVVLQMVLLVEKIWIKMEPKTTMMKKETMTKMGSRLEEKDLCVAPVLILLLFADPKAKRRRPKNGAGLAKKPEDDEGRKSRKIQQ